MLAGNLPFGQELLTCKRYRHFCKWVKEQQTLKGLKFWEDLDNKLEYPQWLFPSKFSSQAKSLIVSMLHPDPACRINVSDAMLHPLNSAQATSSQQVPSVDATITPRSPLVMANVMRSIAVSTPPGSLPAPVASEPYHQEMLSSPVKHREDHPVEDSRTLENIEYDKMASAEADEEYANEGNDERGQEDCEQRNSEEIEIFRMEDDEEQMNTISMEEKSNSYTQSGQAFADASTIDPDHQVFARSSVNWKMECSNSTSIQTLKPAFNESSGSLNSLSTSPRIRRTPPLFPSASEQSDFAGADAIMLSLPTMVDLLSVAAEEDESGSMSAASRKHPSSMVIDGDGFSSAISSPTSPNNTSRSSFPNFSGGNTSSSSHGARIGGVSSSSVHSTSSQASNLPPAFNDLVKRSTRFITAVPAYE
eukprot:gene37429-50515_t